MNKVLLKSYSINQRLVNVHFRKKLVSIDCLPYRNSNDLKLIYEGSRSLIMLIKNDYSDIFGNSLKISESSLHAEIWGHLAAYKIFIWLQNAIKIPFIQKFAAFIIDRSGMIDCGEAKTDAIRWFWNIIGWIFFKD
ncbi:hypothetical protein [Pedobacter sp. ASV28]|uniref:hypothetical protein n=1 Tax=Pedobacter sp. ASV28 TaxID=2795123 RepID=UPI0018ECEE8C|nr:hypothetical protein [Pedobacter sp. ASV28]